MRCEYYKRHEEINKMAREGETIYEAKQRINMKNKVKEGEREKVEKRERLVRLRNMNIRKRNELSGSMLSDYISSWSDIVKEEDRVKERRKEIESR